MAVVVVVIVVIAVAVVVVVEGSWDVVSTVIGTEGYTQA